MKYTDDELLLAMRTSSYRYTAAAKLLGVAPAGVRRRAERLGILPNSTFHSGGKLDEYTLADWVRILGESDGNIAQAGRSLGTQNQAIVYAIGRQFILEHTEAINRYWRPGRHKGLTRNDYAKAWNETRSINGVAKLLGVNRSTAREWLIRLGAINKGEDHEDDTA